MEISFSHLARSVATVTNRSSSAIRSWSVRVRARARARVRARVRVRARAPLLVGEAR